MADKIVIKGARENNLKNINLTLPKNKLIVFTGLSGSGKSSLAFNTIFAEGQRRYVESLSSYARQFLGQMDKPDVDSITGLSPAISIDQKTTSRNPRSTVGTVTEIYDYMRLIFARMGTVHCYNCGKEIVQQTVDQIVDKIIANGDGAKVIIMSPFVRGRKGEYIKQLEGFKRSGYARVKVDGNMYSLDEKIPMDKNVKHDINVVVDRIVIKDGIQKRLTDSVETALKLGEGLVIAEVEGVEHLYNTKYACPDCNISFAEVEPRLFSFNSPFGACPTCTGLGVISKVDPDLIFDNGTKSLNDIYKDGVIQDYYMQCFVAIAEKYKVKLDTPFGKLPTEVQEKVLHGENDLLINYKSGGYYRSRYQNMEGIVDNIERRIAESNDSYRARYTQFVHDMTCPDCHGMRLNKEALSVKIGGKNIYELCQLSINELKSFFENLTLTPSQKIIAERVLKEIIARLDFLVNVGLDYLTLSRSAVSLSGGEAQRIRLATQIGSGLSGVLYILDEPSIGLHQRDNGLLIGTLKKLRDLDNTLIVVEHDEDTMRAADYIVDIGSGAGVHGGEVCAAGSVDDLIKAKTVTGKFLSGELCVEVPKTRREPKDFITITNARSNNLKNVTVKIPMGVFVAVTGVSGSGKSSLINQTLYPAAQNKFNRIKMPVGAVDSVVGLDEVDKVINIDQSPIGRTPRSNPATYTGAFSIIRDLFAELPEAKERGYTSGRFSFNVHGGRCEHCQGDGTIKIEMNFLPDVYVPCEVCHGKRYNRETLEVRYHGKSIADVLDMTIEEAFKFFENVPQIAAKIRTLCDVGLGYVKLGQSATTLSGGEAQRVKLANELARTQTGNTLYILDEPTTGLHSYDVDKLIKILSRLVDSGNSVVVIEHNLDVIKTADYIIDMGFEGGDKGGTVISTGTPEELVEKGVGYTAEFLKRILEQ